MKKLSISIGILIIFFLFIISSSLCLAEVVYEGEVKDNEIFYINSIKHVAKYYPAAEKASIGAGENRILVQKGDCDKIDDMQYCVSEATTGYDEEDGSPISTITLIVSESGPEIEIGRDISDDSPMLNEEVLVTVTLSNIGTEKAIGVTYNDKYPTEVNMQGSTVNKALNTAAWSGSLNPGEEQTFTYTLKFEDFITHKAKAKVTYPSKGKVKTKYSSEEEFTVTRPYTVNTSLNARSFTNDEIIKYTISIENDGEDLLRLEPLTIKLPSGSTVVRRDSGIQGTGQELTYETELSQGNSVTLEVQVKTTKKGEYSIDSELALAAGQHRFTDTTKEEFRVGISDIAAIVNMSPSVVKAGGEVMAEVKVVNMGSDTINVDSINFASNYSDPRGWRNEQLGPGKKFYALNKIIYAPIIYEEKEYFWTISGNYKTTTGKKFDFSETGILTVLPFEKVVDFEETYLLVNESEEYKYVNMTVRVENVKDYTMTELNIIDSLPRGYRVVAGARDFEGEKLGAGEEIKYSYVMRMPVDAEKFEITHTFNAEGKDEKLIFEMPAEIDMAPEALAEEATEVIHEEPTASDEENVTEQVVETQEEEKKGVFSRMWGWLKGLFGSDDGRDAAGEKDIGEEKTKAVEEKKVSLASEPVGEERETPEDTKTEDTEAEEPSGE